MFALRLPFTHYYYNANQQMKTISFSMGFEQS